MRVRPPQKCIGASLRCPHDDADLAWLSTKRNPTSSSLGAVALGHHVPLGRHTSDVDLAVVVIDEPRRL